MDSGFQLFLFAVVLVIVFLVCRAIVLWYFKLDKIAMRLEEIASQGREKTDKQ